MTKAAISAMRQGLVVAAFALALGIGSTSAGAQHGAIAGTALDSLRGNWLTGALVTVEGVGRSAISDSAGDFLIDSVPAGTHRLAVFHPLLDTIALSVMTPHFEVVADSTTDVLVAVPSPSTLLALKCGREAEAAVIGQVSRADNPEPPVSRDHPQWRQQPHVPPGSDTWALPSTTRDWNCGRERDDAGRSQLRHLHRGWSAVAAVRPGRLAVEYILPHEVAAIEVYRAGDVPLDGSFASYTKGCETVVSWTKRRLRVG